jgi:hypothetical protein
MGRRSTIPAADIRSLLKRCCALCEKISDATGRDEVPESLFCLHFLERRAFADRGCECRGKRQKPMQRSRPLDRFPELNAV